MCGGVSHIVWMCVCECGCERVVMNVSVNVSVHMAICVWALTVRKYDCICVRVVHFRAHCMSEHECVCCSVLKSCVTLRPHGMQHARPPCPSPSPWACSNSCPSSRWCHPTLSSSVIPFSCPQSFPASGSFPLCQLFVSGGQKTGVSAWASVLPINIQSWFPLGLTGLISFQSKRPSRVFSSITIQKYQFLSTQPSLCPTLTSILDYWKNHSFDYLDLGGQSDVPTF